MFRPGEKPPAIVRAIGWTAVTLFLLVLFACGGPPAMLNSTNPSLISLVIAPEAPGVAVGQSVQFKATGKFSEGGAVNMSYSAVWTSSNPGIASVNSSGLAITHSIGTATITASCGRVMSGVMFVSLA